MILFRPSARHLMVGAAIAVALLTEGLVPDATLAQPAFRSGIDLVSVSAVVRDRGGRPVRALTRDDFQLFDEGELRPVVEFWVDEFAAVSLAVLFDVSGSMHVGSKIAAAQSTATLLLSRLRADIDEAALFAFDSQLRQLQPYSTDHRRARRALDDLRPYGATSLYDAIAETARHASARTTRHRAVVVLSDGVDTRSRLTAPEVSGIASAIDVPVYLITIVSPLDHPDAPTASPATTGEASQLRDLARWTGGSVFFSSAPADAHLAADRLLGEIRHQYVLAFESASTPGWRRIEVRVPNLHVRTRSAYSAKH